MNRTAFCCLSLTTALILTACSSGGGGVAADIGAGLADALTVPLDHKDKGLQSLTLDQSVRKNEKLKLAAQGAEETYGNGDSLNTGKLKNDKVSRFDFIRQNRSGRAAHYLGERRVPSVQTKPFRLNRPSDRASTRFGAFREDGCETPVQNRRHSGRTYIF